MLYEVSFRTSQNSVVELGCLLCRFLSRWSHTASTIFKSELCGGQSIIVRFLSLVVLSKYDFTAWAVCYESLSCWTMKQLPIRHFSEGIACWMGICLYFSTFRIPSMQKISPTPLAEMEPETITDPLLRFAEGCNTLYCNSY